MLGSRGRRRSSVACAAVVVAVLTAACAGSGYNYVKNGDDKTYFKLPESWKLYDADFLFKRNSRDLSPTQRDTLEKTLWEVRFDGNPKPAFKHFNSTDARYPIGFAEVEVLSQTDSDQASIGFLRDLIFPIDDAAQQGKADVVTYEPVSFEGGVHGIHLVGDIVDDKGRTISFNQIAVLNQDSTKLYLLVVLCNAKCYEANQDKIEKVVDSWTVKD